MSVILTPYGFIFNASGQVLTPGADVTVTHTGRGYYTCQLGSGFLSATTGPIILLTTFVPNTNITHIATVTGYNNVNKSFNIIIETSEPRNADGGCMVMIFFSE